MNVNNSRNGAAGAPHKKHDQRREGKGDPKQSHTKSNAFAKKAPASACKRCGRRHEPRQCPAYGKECNRCHKMNHYAKFCKSNNIDIINVDENGDSLFIGRVENNNNINALGWLETIKINKQHKLEVKLDTGAQCNVISDRKLRKLKIDRKYFQEIKPALTAYGGRKLKVLGKCKLLCEFANRPRSPLEFVVVEADEISAPAVIGFPTLLQLKLIQRIDAIEIDASSPPSVNKILKEHEKVFQGMGCITNFEYDIKLKDDAKPTIAACRKIPIALMDQVKEEL